MLELHVRLTNHGNKSQDPYIGRDDFFKLRAHFMYKSHAEGAVHLAHPDVPEALKAGGLGNIIFTAYGDTKTVAPVYGLKPAVTGADYDNGAEGNELDRLRAGIKAHDKLVRGLNRLDDQLGRATSAGETFARVAMLCKVDRFVIDMGVETKQTTDKAQARAYIDDGIATWGDAHGREVGKDTHAAG